MMEEKSSLPKNFAFYVQEGEVVYPLLAGLLLIATRFLCA